jgi:CubicO group peptidase (beta-lactamase class C family)
MLNLMLALVTRDSILFAGGFGLENLSSRERVIKKTLFPMGSVTKTFTALAIQRLIDDGRLSLSTRLKDIAPEVPFNNLWEKAHPVTISNLLEHTTGFDDVHFNALFNNERNSSQYYAVLTFRKSMTCRWRPGERTAYRNTDYVILGYLIEKLSGEPYGRFLKENILDPLGMSRSNFNDLYAPTRGYAQGYNWDDGQYIAIAPLHIYGKGEGGLYSNAEDMASFSGFY